MSGCAISADDYPTVASPSDCGKFILWGVYKNTFLFVLFVFEDRKGKSVTWNWFMDLDRINCRPCVFCSHLIGKCWEALLCRGNAISFQFVECYEHVYSSAEFHFLSWKKPVLMRMQNPSFLEDRHTTCCARNVLSAAGRPCFIRPDTVSPSWQ
jgi:hypothetical protein